LTGFHSYPAPSPVNGGRTGWGEKNRRIEELFFHRNCSLRPTHGEVPAYNNAGILFSQARYWELDGTVFQPTPSPSGHLGEGRLCARNRHAFVGGCKPERYHNVISLAAALRFLVFVFQPVLTFISSAAHSLFCLFVFGLIHRFDDSLI
jgi:hypothetical protein